MEEPRPERNGTAPAAKRAARHAVALCRNRAELFLLEAEEERRRVTLALLLAGACGALGLLAGVAITILVVVACWPEHAILGASALAAFYALGALVCYWRFMQVWRDWRSFHATVDEFKKDLQMIEEAVA